MKHALQFASLLVPFAACTDAAFEPRFGKLALEDAPIVMSETDADPDTDSDSTGEDSTTGDPSDGGSSGPGWTVPWPATDGDSIGVTIGATLDPSWPGSTSGTSWTGVETWTDSGDPSGDPSSPGSTSGASWTGVATWTATDGDDTGDDTYGGTGGDTYGSTGGNTYGSTDGNTYGGTDDTYGGTGGDTYAETGGDTYAETGGDTYDTDSDTDTEGDTDEAPEDEINYCALFPPNASSDDNAKACTLPKKETKAYCHLHTCPDLPGGPDPQLHCKMPDGANVPLPVLGGGLDCTGVETDDTADPKCNDDYGGIEVTLPLPDTADCNCCVVPDTATTDPNLKCGETPKKCVQVFFGDKCGVPDLKDTAALKTLCTAVKKKAKCMAKTCSWKDKQHKRNGDKYEMMND